MSFIDRRDRPNPEELFLRCLDDVMPQHEVLHVEPAGIIQRLVFPFQASGLQTSKKPSIFKLTPPMAEFLPFWFTEPVTAIPVQAISERLRIEWHTLPLTMRCHRSTRRVGLFKSDAGTENKRLRLGMTWPQVSARIRTPLYAMDRSSMLRRSMLMMPARPRKSCCDA